MTSTASQQNTVPTPTNATAVPSYASAAGSTGSKKAVVGATPLIASGTNQPPVVVGSSAPAVQHAKSSSISPVNGRPPVAPAVPQVAAMPAVAHGSSSTVNGGGAPSADHGRKPSVTLGPGVPNGPSPPTGPSGAAAYGGAVGGSRPQFMFNDSPAIAHSTPHPPAQPVPIPTNNQRIPSPARSPAPIPAQQQSGGRPPSGMAPAGNGMVFGSLGGDGEVCRCCVGVCQVDFPLTLSTAPHETALHPP